MNEHRLPSLDVVVPTHNTRAATLRCVESIVSQSGVDLRCLVVDNASVDGTAAAIAARWPDVTVIDNEANVGYGRACNRGAAASSGDLLLFLNSDIVVHDGSLERLVAFLAQHPQHVAATGRLVDLGSDRVQYGFAIRAYPRLSAQLALLFGLERAWPTNRVSRRQLMADFDWESTQDLTGQPAGACILCRREAFEAVGGFDERFAFWFDDVDFLRRLSRVGPIAYVHDAVFDHAGSLSFSAWDRADVIRARYAGLLRYFRKHHSRGENAALRGVIAALAAVRSLALVPFDRDSSIAYLEVARLALASDRDRSTARPKAARR